MLVIAAIVVSLSLITFGVCLLAAERGYSFDLRRRPNIPRLGGARRSDRIGRRAELSEVSGF